MIEQITAGNAHEMDRRYRDTYGFFKTSSGKRILVNVRAVDTRFTIVRDFKGNDYQLNSDTGCELEFTHVPSQWFQPNPKTLVYVCRIAERQFKRGICQANTQLRSPQKNGKSLFTIDVTPERIAQLYYKDEDLNAFAKSVYEINCGLWSKYFAWAEETVYLRDIVIGKVDHKTKEIILDDHDLFQQEMRDALVRCNSEYKVAQKVS
jgi:hypothetical protein